MTFEQAFVFGLFLGFFALLIWGRIRYDIVAFAALIIGVIAGVVPSSGAFDGFGHPATIIVALVLVVSAGLVRSGVVFLITQKLVDSSRSVAAHIGIMGAIGGVLSAFMNNVAALALLMPVDVQTAAKAKRAASLTLMPLSFATILGGMATLIGTPPNIIISGLREDAYGEPFKMFDFAPVGGAVAIIGLIFVALVGRHLVPDRGRRSAEQEYSDYVAELSVSDENEVIGKSIADLIEQADAAGVEILGVVRKGGKRFDSARRSKIQAGDALLIEAQPEALEEFRLLLKLSITDEERAKRLDADGKGIDLIELVVPEGARIEGTTAVTIGLAWRRNSVLLGISRQGKPIRQRLRSTKVQAGDVLLLLVPRETGSDVANWLGCMPLAARGLAVTVNEKSYIAIGVFAAAVIAASFGLIYLPVALGAVVIAYVLMNILPLADLYDHINWPVIVLLGSLIPLGQALEDVGGTKLLAELFVSNVGAMPDWVILSLLMILTMTLSDVLNNTATTIVAAPVGMEIAASLNVSADPFLMAIAIAASSAFLTPIGHKNNMLIMGPGSYSFGDYWRMGLPLEILIVAVSIPLILIVWPL